MLKSFIKKLKKHFERPEVNSQQKLNSQQKANEIIKSIEDGETPISIESRICTDKNDWHRCSSVAYNLYLLKARKERKIAERKPHVSATSNKEVEEILEVNNILADHALSMSILSTAGDLRHIQEQIKHLPSSELQIIEVIGKITMHPRYRVLQKKGRFEKFDHFRLFTKMIDAATLSYYRTNFISCYLTLLPIVEGIIIRWMGYTEKVEKPEFEDIRKFFKNSHVRQPCPYNIAFHNVYTKACNKILNEHFYKPTIIGGSYSNFNRHVASHILNDNQFATKANCIRLFNLIDTMTEIYLYESRGDDPRFTLSRAETDYEIELYASAILDNIETRPEHTLLDTLPTDILGKG